MTGARLVAQGIAKRFPGVVALDGVGLEVGVGEVVAVHVAQQHGIDFAQAAVFSATHGAAHVVQDTGAIGIFEHQRTIERAKLTTVAAQRGHFDIG